MEEKYRRKYDHKYIPSSVITDSYSASAGNNRGSVLGNMGICTGFIYSAYTERILTLYWWTDETKEIADKNSL